MCKNVDDKECTEEYCDRWGYQCESTNPGCLNSRPWYKPHIYIRPSKEEYERGEDEARIKRLQARGYTVSKNTER